MKPIFKRLYPRPAKTRRAYLDQLGKKLIPLFPFSQVREVLSDYRERFDAGREQDRTDAELIKALGTPQEAAAQLLEENPPSGLLRHYLLWGALLVLCLTFFWFFVLLPYPAFMAWLCGGLFLPMIAGVLFPLLRGGARTELEKQFPPEKAAPQKLLFGVPLITAAVFTVGHQLWITAVLRDPGGMSAIDIGILNQLFCFGLAGVMALLALWWLVRCVTRSIRYFPGVIHALGLAVAALTDLVPFLSMSLDDPFSPDSIFFAAMLYFLPYLAGLVTALVFQRWLDAGFPACFRQPDGGRQDYLDKLGKCLLRWFPAGQVCEILADYQEQFELGLERGKSEAVLAEELGRPETVARDLLAAENPLLRRSVGRRDLLWTVLLLPAACVLLGMFFRFEYGNLWLDWPDLAPAFLALGAAAMFALLRGSDRAQVEGRFPPERGEAPVWTFLLPLLDVAVAAAGLWYILMGSPLYEDGGITPTAVAATCFIELSVLLLTVLLVWTLSRSFGRSVRYFPAAIQATGAAMGCLKTATVIRHVYIDPLCRPTATDSALHLLEGMFPYFVSLALAALFWTVIRVYARRGKED